MPAGQGEGVQHSEHLLLLRGAPAHLLHHHRGQVQHGDHLGVLDQVFRGAEEAVLQCE